MITAVCLNPCIDRTVSVREFNYGGLNRVVASRSDAGGKGVNVAITAARLGLDTSCIDFLPYHNSAVLEEKLTNEGVHFEAVSLDGTLRTNLKILDESKNIITEVNESGAPVAQDELDQMTRLVLRLASVSDYLILSGSLPPACPADYYGRLIREVSALSCRCILDADGACLAEGLKARPYLVKPNLPELEGLTGRTLSSLRDVDLAARQLVDSGVGIVAVSMGSEGAFITDGTVSQRAPSVDVAVRSTVGAGDAMIAGLTAGLCRSRPLDEIFRMGMASATASIMSEGTQLVNKNVYLSLLDRVQIERVCLSE